MRTPSSIAALAPALALAAFLAAAPASGAVYQVPSAGTPTLQSAVAAAAANADPDNVIFINQSPFFTSAKVQVGNQFNSAHRLTIRPGAGMPFGRATVASQNGSQTIFEMLSSGSVTIQDLDLVRYSTNNADLVFMDNCRDILIERCRIGSVWSSVGSAGWSNVVMSYPTRVTVRNCILFSALFGNFASGLRASFGDADNSLYLYNNTVADYSGYGIEIADPMAHSLVVLRNNVAINNAAAAVEPFAYHSVVDVQVRLVTSHNTAFSTLGHVEVVGDDQWISGLGGDGWRRLLPADAAGSFVTTAWSFAGGFNPAANRDLFRLDSKGLLHDEALDHGVTVLNGVPNALDHAVTDDWERDHRPGGSTSHTDRGADQIESGVVAVEPVAREAGVLWAAAPVNPARLPAVSFRASVAGRLHLDVFDAAGRCVHRDARAVSAGESGSFRWTGTGSSGVCVYRMRLSDGSGEVAERRGRIVVLR